MDQNLIRLTKLFYRSSLLSNIVQDEESIVINYLKKLTLFDAATTLDDEDDEDGEDGEDRQDDEFDVIHVEPEMVHVSHMTAINAADRLIEWMQKNDPENSHLEGLHAIRHKVVESIDVGNVMKQSSISDFCLKFSEELR